MSKKIEISEYENSYIRYYYPYKHVKFVHNKIQEILINVVTEFLNKSRASNIMFYHVDKYKNSEKMLFISAIKISRGFIRYKHLMPNYITKRFLYRINKLYNNTNVPKYITEKILQNNYYLENIYFTLDPNLIDDIDFFKEKHINISSRDKLLLPYWTHLISFAYLLNPRFIQHMIINHDIHIKSTKIDYDIHPDIESIEIPYYVIPDKYENCYDEQLNDNITKCEPLAELIYSPLLTIFGEYKTQRFTLNIITFIAKKKINV